MDITTASMITTLNISVWTAAKNDRTSASKVQEDAGATSKGAVTARKHLFADNDKLAAVRQVAAKAREYLNFNTHPWDDNGRRLLPTKMFFDVQQRLGEFEREFNAAVADFITDYDNAITVAAFKMGNLFNRAEYPQKDEVLRKFAFSITHEPVPQAGHFVVDINTEAQAALRQTLEQATAKRLQTMQDTAYTRVKETIEGLITKCREGKRFHESTFATALDLCAVLDGLNVTGDPRITDMKQALQRTLNQWGSNGTALCDAAKEPATRADMAQSLTSLRDQFGW